MRRLPTLVAVFLLAGVFAFAGGASACAVCYGGADDAMTQGMNNGILTLLGVVGIVQIGFVAMFVSFWRRGKRFQDQRDKFQLIDGGTR